MTCPTTSCTIAATKASAAPTARAPFNSAKTLAQVVGPDSIRASAVCTQRSRAMSLFPMFLKLQDRPCLVVGAGAIGEGKAQSLLEAGALVCVVAPGATQRRQELAATGAITWVKRKFTPADLDGKSLVIAATSSPSVNDLVFRESRKRHVLCNAVDDPPHCDFFYGAVVRRGDLQIAISTNGKSPAFAQRLRELLEQQFGPEFAEKVDDLGAAREKLFRSKTEPSLRKQLLHRMAQQQIVSSTQPENPSTVAT